MSLLEEDPALRAPQYTGGAKMEWGTWKRPVSGVRAYLLGTAKVWGGRGPCWGVV